MLHPSVRSLSAPFFALLVTACGSSGDSGAPEGSTNDGGAEAGAVDAAGLQGNDAAIADARTGSNDSGDHAPDGGPAPDDASGANALAASFVFVGCNRLQKADWDTATNPSSANLPQLQQTFADVTALPVTPRLFFFTGDLVLALKQATTNLASQLDAWAQVYKGDPIAAKVPVVPLVGNHEMLYKDTASGLEFSNGPSDAVWTQWLTVQGFSSRAGNGPTTAPPNADALQDDESMLSYSFDDGGIHYVVLNTDTWTTTADSTTQSTQIGWIALHWLTSDLASAQANPNVSSIFVFGHKPIVSPSGGTGGDSAISPDLVPSLESLLDGTPKVKGYLCAHAHEWDARKLPGSRGVYQVVAGNGGSQLESGWNVSTPYYGFTEARVYESGRVGIVSYQRAVPNPYNATPAAPAVAVAELTIAP